MYRATWNGAILAESDATVVVEGNHYFPPEAVRREHLGPSASHTICPWKGRAGYYDVVVDDRVNHDAAWFYADPKPRALSIAGHIAFWHGVRVQRVVDGSPEADSGEPLWTRLRRRLTG